MARSDQPPDLARLALWLVVVAVLVVLVVQLEAAAAATPAGTVAPLMVGPR
ncbi:hypothetical protein [Candidatus Poriferisocius sp.]|uniref:hypothetical protein n=1 Tax=Candidatus Poriferisocius sp. TaxID=3101276 RepID=UPI003B5C131A